MNGPISSINSTTSVYEKAKHSLESGKANRFSSFIKIANTINSRSVFMCSSAETGLDTDSRGNLIVVRLTETTPEKHPLSLQATLEASGWTITQQTYPFSKPTDGAVVLILDEL